MIDPADDDTPEDVAVEMGLAARGSYDPSGATVHRGWRPLDPAVVGITTAERDGRLVIYVQYAGGLD